MLKWIAVETHGPFKGSPWHITNTKGQLVVEGLYGEQAQKIAAAHNAIIDMAFDSPGNVS